MKLMETVPCSDTSTFPRNTAVLSSTGLPGCCRVFLITFFPNVNFLTAHTAIDLITPSHHGMSIHQRYESHKVVGAYLLDQKSNEVKKI